jgi:uncharacterized repeat protein (TIGR03803 family)
LHGNRIRDMLFGQNSDPGGNMRGHEVLTRICRRLDRVLDSRPGLTENDSRKINLVRTIQLTMIVFAGGALPAQTFNSIASFDYTDGANPYAVSLVQGYDGNYYGTTQQGGTGAIGGGEVFKISPSGSVTGLYSFCTQSGCTDGKYPLPGLWLARNGNFYGTTEQGGANGQGTIFEITPQGTLTTLYNFCSQSGCTDGSFPQGGVIQASNGNFYGTASGGGGAASSGTVFELTAAGKFTNIFYFGGVNGSQPVGTLVQGTNGNLYGTAEEGGSAGHGTIFEITPTGNFTLLYTFCTLVNCDDGAMPAGALVQASNGTFYGTAAGNGLNGGGTLFAITASGKFNVLYNFCSQSGCADGQYPYGSLIQATDGNFYGTTQAGGASGQGTVFELNPRGVLTVLHSFDTTDGSQPDGGLVQGTDGSFYGTTHYGGTASYGTVFNLSNNLGPFVEALPNSGKVKSTVNILGNNLTGTTSVSFNGTNATFRVISSSQITAAVPAGATTGSLTVVTPGGSLKSNVTFRVTPQFLSFSPPSGPVGTVVTITGVSLTQTTRVTFGGGVSAAFTVNSDTQVSATVPTGAVTGPIVITTAGGTARSSTSFTVTP